MEINLHLLLTEEIENKKPESIKTLFDFGSITIITSDGEKIKGKNICVSGTLEDLHKWLLPFEFIWAGNGSPIMEKFTYLPIKKELNVQQTLN